MGIGAASVPMAVSRARERVDWCVRAGKETGVGAMRRWAAGAAAVSAALLGACAGEAAEGVGAPEQDASERFVAAPGILAGFEVGPDPLTYRTGDRVLIGLRVERSSGVVEKYLKLTLISDTPMDDGSFSFDGQSGRLEAAVRSYLAFAEAYDAQGKELGATVVRIPAVGLYTGVFDYASLSIESASWDEARKQAAKGDVAMQERAAVALLSLIMHGRMLRDTKELNALAEGMIRRPGVFDLVLGGGFEIKDGAPSRTGEPVVLGSSAPMPSVEVNQEFYYGWTMLGPLSGTVVRSVPPLGLAGGLVSGIADNPGHGSRIEVRLLAARRGDGEEWKPELPVFVRRK